MWRNLLAERFGMAARIEKNEVAGRELVVAKGGPKLQASRPADAEQPEKPIIDNGRLKGPGLAVSYRFSGGVQTAKVMANAQRSVTSVSSIKQRLGELVRLLA
jgi:uncharacterized protein (TIGR03435 family)